VVGGTRCEGLVCIRKHVDEEPEPRPGIVGLLPATLSAHGAAAFVGDGSATLHGDGHRLSRI